MGKTRKSNSNTSNNLNISESGDESVPDEFAMDDAMDKLEFQPDDTPFSQFSHSEINHIGEYLEANNNMDRFWEEDLPDEPYFEGETIWDYALDISPHWTGNLHSYFGDGKENTRYGNGQVPGDLAMKVLVEEITGKTFTDASGQTAGYRMLEKYGVTPPELVNDFIEYYEDTTDAIVIQDYEIVDF